MPPGLTGLAQIHGRYHTDAEYKLGYDLQYLVNWSPVLDLEIIARTIWVILARAGREGPAEHAVCRARRPSWAAPNACDNFHKPSRRPSVTTPEEADRR